MRKLRLTDQAVHLWIAELDCSAALLNKLAKTLSIDEGRRADRFLFARDRSRFIATRGILRDIVSRYLGCAPADIRFGCGPNGKPTLAPMQASTLDLRFNLSHSGGVALYGVTSGRELGVDIESIRHEIPWRELATSFFTRDEIAELQRWPVHERTTGFFSCWTRKEAYLKACGEGLSSAVHTFQFCETRNEAPMSVTTLDSEDLQRWSTWKVALRDGFAGALVTEGRPTHIRLLQWNWGCTHSPTITEGRRLGHQQSLPRPAAAWISLHSG